MIDKAMITSDAAKAAAREMRKHFLVPFELAPFLQPLQALREQVPALYCQPVDAFCSAIQAVHSTSSFPYLLASSKASALHFQRFIMAERIRNLQDEFEPPESRKTEEEIERIALQTAHERFSNFQASEEGLNLLVSELSRTLLDALHDPQTSCAARELLYQGLVSLWSAFEVVVRDVLILLLNALPEQSEQLLSDPTSKKYFDLPKVSIDDLSSSGYNLSNKMGDLLLGSRDFSDIRAIKAAVNAVFRSRQTAEALDSESLWRLNQNRHLIVHRRGIVDAKYIRATGSGLAAGQVVTVSPKQMEEYFTCVVSATTSILSSLGDIHR